MKKSAIVLLAVAGMAATASAVITLDIAAVDATDAPITTATVGDTVYFLLTASWTGNDEGLGGVKVDFLITGAGVGNVSVDQTPGAPAAFQTAAGTEGMHPLMKNAISDNPPTVWAAAGTLYAGSAETVVSDTNLGAGSTNFIDLVVLPPSFTFQILPNNSIIYRLAVIYKGGKLNVELQVDEGFGTTYTDFGSVSGNFTTVSGDGNFASVVPAPASIALLGLGGLVATRRRR